MTSTIISCQIHDYIEIACIYGYRVVLTLKAGHSIEGRPVTTLSTEQREYLVIETGEGEQRVELNQIKRMQALSANPHFDTIDF